MTSARRVADTGLLAGAPAVAFSFDGRRHTGVAGESLAAALIASGERIVALELEDDATSDLARNIAGTESGRE